LYFIFVRTSFGKRLFDRQRRDVFPNEICIEILVHSWTCEYASRFAPSIILAVIHVVVTSQ
jgi:hypothetical protein